MAVVIRFSFGGAAESLEMLVRGACCLTTGSSTVTYEVKNLSVVCHICPDQRDDTGGAVRRWEQLSVSSSANLSTASHACGRARGFSRTVSLLPNENDHHHHGNIADHDNRRDRLHSQTGVG